MTLKIGSYQEVRKGHPIPLHNMYTNMLAESPINSSLGDEKSQELTAAISCLSSDEALPQLIPMDAHLENVAHDE